MPAHPTQEQVQAEYETVWQTLDGRPIESLIDLPLMTDPELQAAMQVLSVLLAPAYFTDSPSVLPADVPHGEGQHAARDERRFRTRLCHLGDSSLGPVFHRYGDGYRFAKLACDLVEKHGFIAVQAKVYVAIGIGCLLDAADRDRDRFRCGRAFAPRLRRAI